MKAKAKRKISKWINRNMGYVIAFTLVDIPVTLILLKSWEALSFYLLGVAFWGFFKGLYSLADKWQDPKGNGE